jgi:Melibiase
LIDLADSAYNAPMNLGRLFMKRWVLVLFALLALISCDEEGNGVDDTDVADIYQAAGVCSTSVSFDESAQTFSIFSRACGVGYEEVHGKLGLIRSGERVWYPFETWPERTVTESDRGAVWTLSGKPGLPTLRVRINDAGNGFSIATSVSAGDNAATIAAVRFHGRVALPGEPEEVRWLHNGHDSWTFTGIADLTQDDDPIPNRAGVEAAIGNNYGYWEDRKQVSWWTTAMRGPASRYGLVAGALDTKLFKTYFVSKYDRVDGWQLSAISGTIGDSKALVPGQNLELDPVMILLTPDPVRGLVEYADQVAKRRPPMIWNGDFAPKGWASWYFYFADVTQEDVVSNLAVLRDQYLEHGFEVCQLDDGYMKHWGDWQETNSRFPNGLGTLAETIIDAGLVPGIWMAPLYAHKDSNVFGAHPDWFLHNVDGSELVTGDLFLTDYRVLDVTHPEAAEWLAGQVTQMVALGYRYLKLDFLFVGSVEAPRYEPNVTSMEAYARACDIISEAAGDGVYLLASGEPFLPSAGRFHAARTSSDIATTFPSFATWKLVHNIARMNAARFYAEGRFFENDPDQLLLRNYITDDLAPLTLASNLLLGSNLFLGDALDKLSAERRALINSALSAEFQNLTGPTLPLDLFEGGVDRVINFPYSDFLLNQSVTPKIFLRDGLLMIINWYKNPRTIRLTPAQLGFPATAGLVATERDTYEKVVANGGEMQFIVGGREIAVYELAEATE